MSHQIELIKINDKKEPHRKSGADCAITNMENSWEGFNVKFEQGEEVNLEIGQWRLLYVRSKKKNN